MKTEVFQLTSDPMVTLTTYILDSYSEMLNTAVRPGILLSPGGGFIACSDREAEPVAMAFMAEGYHVFILRYSLNENATFPRPLQDAEEALVLIRKNAEKWGVDSEKIAACGFSAGGYVSAALGTMGRVRPNALILGYPGILERYNTFIQATIPGIEKEVDGKTPPTFIFSTYNDEIVSVEHTLRFGEALRVAGVPFEMHIFQNGFHGLSLAKPITSGGRARFINPAVAKWFELCVTWLEGLGWGFLEAVTTDNIIEYSIDVPLSILSKNDACKQLINNYIPGFHESPQLEAAMDMSLRSINQAGGRFLPEELMYEIDNKLKEIPFIRNNC